MAYVTHEAKMRAAASRAVSNSKMPPRRLGRPLLKKHGHSDQTRVFQADTENGVLVVQVRRDGKLHTLVWGAIDDPDTYKKVAETLARMEMPIVFREKEDVQHFLPIFPIDIARTVEAEIENELPGFSIVLNRDLARLCWLPDNEELSYTQWKIRLHTWSDEFVLNKVIPAPIKPKDIEDFKWPTLRQWRQMLESKNLLHWIQFIKRHDEWRMMEANKGQCEHPNRFVTKSGLVVSGNPPENADRIVVFEHKTLGMMEQSIKPVLVEGRTNLPDGKWALGSALNKGSETRFFQIKSDAPRRTIPLDLLP